MYKKIWQSCTDYPVEVCFGKSSGTAVIVVISGTLFTFPLSLALLLQWNFHHNYASQHCHNNWWCTLQAKPPFAFLSKAQKRRLCLNCVKLLKSLKSKLWDYSILLSIIKLVFWAECEHPFIDKPMAIASSLLHQVQGYQTWVQNCIPAHVHTQQRFYLIHVESF